MVLGGIVAAIYRRTRYASQTTSSFTVTLVLLSILIAMVTQVIGDNVARAFSLVGALSIVRFRTVVRDTQDTAYVIFAVAVGMAVGAAHPWLAIGGIVVIRVCGVPDAGASGGDSPGDGRGCRTSCRSAWASAAIRTRFSRPRSTAICEDAGSSRSPRRDRDSQLT